MSLHTNAPHLSLIKRKLMSKQQVCSCWNVGKAKLAAWMEFRRHSSLQWKRRRDAVCLQCIPTWPVTATLVVCMIDTFAHFLIEVLNLSCDTNTKLFLCLTLRNVSRFKFFSFFFLFPTKEARERKYFCCCCCCCCGKLGIDDLNSKTEKREILQLQAEGTFTRLQPFTVTCAKNSFTL